MDKDQAARAKGSVEKTGWCAKEEVNSSLLGKLAPPCLCYKHIPSLYLVPAYVSALKLVQLANLLVLSVIIQTWIAGPQSSLPQPLYSPWTSQTQALPPDHCHYWKQSPGSSAAGPWRRGLSDCHM